MSTIAIVGGLLLLAFIVAIALLEARDTLNPESLKEMRRSGRHAFPKKLVYRALVRPGIVSLTNDGFLAAWEIEGTDDAKMSASQVQIAYKRFSNALRSAMPDGATSSGMSIMFRQALVPKVGYSVPTSYPHFVHKLLDLRRRRFFNRVGTNYGTRLFMSLTWVPDRGRLAGLQRSIESRENDALSQHDKFLDEFEAAVLKVQRQFSKVSPLRRLAEFTETDERGLVRERSDLLGYLHYAVSGSFTPMVVPPAGAFLGSYIGQHEFVAGYEPRIDGEYVKSVVVKGFPDETTPKILAHLAQRKIPHDLTIRVQLLTDEEARKRLQGVFGDWDAMQQSGGEFASLDAEEMKESTRVAARDVSRGRLRWVLATTVVVLRDRDRDRLEANAAIVQQEFVDKGFPAIVPRMGAEHALLGTFDGDLHHNARRFMLTSLNIGHMYPFHTITSGREHSGAPSLGANDSPLYYALAVGSEGQGVSRYRGHLNVGDLFFGYGIGIAGTGKSTMIGFLAHSIRARMPNSGVTLFDRGGRLRGLAEWVDGTYVNPLDDTSHGIGFFDGIEDRPTFIEKLRALETMAVLQGVEVTPSRRESLVRTLTLMQSFPPASRTMTIFNAQLQDPERVLSPVYHSWTREGGIVGNLLDSTKSAFRQSRLTVIEIGEVLKLPPAYAIPLLKILFDSALRHARDMKKIPNAHKLLWVFMLDEAWVLTQNPVGRQLIIEIFKTVRKEDMGLYLWTHSASNITDYETEDGLNFREEVTRMAQKRFFFADDTALEESQRNAYAKLSLDTKACERLTDITPKGQLLVDDPDESVALDMAFDKLTLTIIAPESVDELLDYKARFGQEWREKFLRDKGFSAAADELARYRIEAGASLTASLAS
jgi:type IV secretion system protein VirB4